ncbi:MAG: hypothetical protein QNJ32_02870 [Xenococcaceae cyanobacterium MO_167.B27]|nr:hypothetical protein [Xenococcaceae cyanobacterium MO_167.B27]
MATFVKGDVVVVPFPVLVSVTLRLTATRGLTALQQNPGSSTRVFDSLFNLEILVYSTYLLNKNFARLAKCKRAKRAKCYVVLPATHTTRKPIL